MLQKLLLKRKPNQTFFIEIAEKPFEEELEMAIKKATGSCSPILPTSGDVLSLQGLTAEMAVYNDTSAYAACRLSLAP